MSRKKVSIENGSASVEESPAVETTAPEPVLSKPMPSSKPMKTTKPAEPMLTFDRWFATTGRPAHHKAGMRAYVNVKGKRTKAFWDGLFKSY